MLSEKLNILVEVLGSYEQKREEYLFYCPICQHHKHKLSININKNKFHCWICSFAADDIVKLFRRLGKHEQIRKWQEVCGIGYDDTFDLKQLLNGEKVEEIIQQDVQLPQEFISLIDNYSLSSFAARKYLQKRNINEEDIYKFKIGFATSGNFFGRIIFPSFQIDGNLNYFVSRTYVDQEPKYKNSFASKDIIFNEINVDFRKLIYLVEGIFDSIVVGDNSIKFTHLI